MKKTTSLYLALVALLLIGCGPSQSGPFLGKMNFTVSVMGENLDLDGSITMDVANQKAYYSVGGFDMMGISEMAYMVDAKEKVAYTINSKRKNYYKTEIEQDMMEEVTRDLPSQEDIDEVKSNLEKALQPTGNSKQIAGYTAQEYKLDAKEMGEEGWAKVWLSKDLLARMKPAVQNIDELKHLNLEAFYEYGFPMEMVMDGRGMENFIFKITSIEEGNTNAFAMDGMEEVSQKKFTNQMFEDMGMGDIFGEDGLEDMLEGLEDLDLDLEKELEGIGTELEKSLEDLDLEKLDELQKFLESENHQ